MDISTINNIIFSIVITVCITGILEDIKQRRFSNSKIFIMIVLGIYMSYSSDRLLNGMILFLSFNILGVFMSHIGLLGAADWKLFSTMSLFIPFEILQTTILFISVVLLTSILMKIFYTNRGHLKEALRDEWNALKVFIYTRKKLSYDNENNTYKCETVPMSVPLGAAFITCIIALI